MKSIYSRWTGASLRTLKGSLLSLLTLEERRASGTEDLLAGGEEITGARGRKKEVSEGLLAKLGEVSGAKGRKNKGMGISCLRIVAKFREDIVNSWIRLTRGKICLVVRCAREGDGVGVGRY